MNTFRVKLTKRLKYYVILSILTFYSTVYGPIQAQETEDSKITIQVENEPLKSVFKKISKTSHYKFFYDEKLIQNSPKITLNVNNVEITVLLAELTRQSKLEFIVTGNTITVATHKEAQDTFQKVRQKYTGIVSDDKGESIIGASVTLKDNQSIGTITDMDGNFTIEASIGAILQVSYIGFTTQEVKLGDKTLINITLKEDAKVLDEVVVVGYGVQSQKLVTTSISKLKMDGVDKGNDSDPIKMLQGRIAGVNISSSSGSPGTTPNISIRGVGSISGGNSPLYVVDGVPSEKYPSINPNDIESIEVLKDASAAAIYGSRANSGVVIMTTKSGRSGKTVVDVSSRIGFGSVANDIEMANSEEYQRTMQAAINNYNQQMGTNLSLFVPGTIQETNWIDEIARNNSFSTNNSISLSGGDNKTTFYTSLGANIQEGYLIKSKYNQYNLRAKFSHRINSIFKLNMNLSGAATRNNLLEESSTSLKVLRTAREEQPWYSPYKEDGTYKVNGTEISRHNPLMLINEEDWVKRKYQLSGVFSIDITPFEGFKYTPSISMYSIYDKETKKLTDKHDARKNNAGWGALTQQKDHSFRYVIDNVFSYTNEWDKLSYSAMIGHSFEKYVYDQFGAKSDNYANDAFPSPNFNLINAGANIYPASINYTSYALESYFGRLALNWDNKYILNATLRSDGSSRFAKSKRYGYFPSVSGAWRFTNENFFPKNSIINDGKFRVSWGKTGSMDGVSNYAPLSLVGSSGGSYNGAAGLQITQDARDLTWEKANQYNLGLDIEFFNSRLVLSIDAFYQKTTDLLFNQPVNSTTGYKTIEANIGSLENKGLEIALSGDILTGDFKWDMSGNISFVKNKLLSLIEGNNMYIVPSVGSNLLGGSMHILQNGKPISTYYMLKMEGIYQNDNEVPEKLYAKGVRAGDVRYQDINDDGDISDADRQDVGKASPDFYGGITSNFSYKGFDLSLFSQFSVGGKIVAAWRGVNGVEGTDHLGLAKSNVKIPGQKDKVEQFFNISKDAANNYWTGPGSTNKYPRPVRQGVHTGYSHDYNVQTSTRYLESATYFKLKTITLGYTLPETITDKIGINNLRVFASVDNLFTITPYSGYDPEASFSGSPGHSNYGVDFGLQPLLRTFLFGFNLSF